MDIQILNTEKINDKYYKIIDTNTSFAGTKINYYAGEAGALKLVDSNGNTSFAGTYSENLNTTIYEDAICLDSDTNDIITFGKSTKTDNKIILNVTKNNSISLFHENLTQTDNKNITIVVDKNNSNSPIISFAKLNRCFII